MKTEGDPSWCSIVTLLSLDSCSSLFSLPFFFGSRGSAASLPARLPRIRRRKSAGTVSPCRASFLGLSYGSLFDRLSGPILKFFRFGNRFYWNIMTWSDKVGIEWCQRNKIERWKFHFLIFCSFVLDRLWLEDESHAAYSTGRGQLQGYPLISSRNLCRFCITS